MDSSSEIWGDVSVQINTSFSVLNELSSSEYSRIVLASRYGRKWILKALNSSVGHDMRYREMLRKEFEILIPLDNDSIVKPYNIEEVEDLGLCIVMEYVEGMTLDEFLAMDPAKSIKLKVLRKILDAVDYIHGKQIVHRDIKPSNIIVSEDGNCVKLIDFGLADSASFELLKGAAGTEGYVSPEQKNGGSIDSRNDIYSIGCIMRDMNLGRRYDKLIGICTGDISKRPSAKALLEGLPVEFTARLLKLAALVVLPVAIVLGILFFDKTAIWHSAQLRNYMDAGRMIIDFRCRGVQAFYDSITSVRTLPVLYESFDENMQQTICEFVAMNGEQLSKEDSLKLGQSLMNYYSDKQNRWTDRLKELSAKKRDTPKQRDGFKAVRKSGNIGILDKNGTLLTRKQAAGLSAEEATAIVLTNEDTYIAIPLHDSSHGIIWGETIPLNQYKGCISPSKRANNDPGFLIDLWYDDGSANTKYILKIEGINDNCAAFVAFNDAAGKAKGVRGAYLPTLYEMRFLHKNRDAINECIADLGGEPVDGLYWTSDCHPAIFRAWSYNVVAGNAFADLVNEKTPYSQDYGTPLRKVRAMLLLE